MWVCFAPLYRAEYLYHRHSMERGSVVFLPVLVWQVFGLSEREQNCRFGFWGLQMSVWIFREEIAGLVKIPMVWLECILKTLPKSDRIIG